MFNVKFNPNVYFNYEQVLEVKLLNKYCNPFGSN